MNLIEILIVVVLLLWLLGFLTVPALGGFVHVLLVILVVLIIVRLIQGRRVL